MSVRWGSVMWIARLFHHLYLWGLWNKAPCGTCSKIWDYGTVYLISDRSRVWYQQRFSKFYCEIVFLCYLKYKDYIAINFANVLAALLCKLCGDQGQNIQITAAGIFNFLSHWGQDEMATILQTTLSNAFSWMKMLEFRLRFHWILFLRVQLTIFEHWFR